LKRTVTEFVEYTILYYRT